MTRDDLFNVSVCDMCHSGGLPAKATVWNALSMRQETEHLPSDLVRGPIILGSLQSLSLSTRIDASYVPLSLLVSPFDHQTNASTVNGLVEGCAQFCPDAVLTIISNPVNSTVPIEAEVLKAKGVYNPRKLCGVTTLDVIRANTFVGEHLGKDPADVSVTVVGGHAGITILPLFSQVPGFHPSPADLDAMTVRVQFGGDEGAAERTETDCFCPRQSKV
jgi:hypothetical protein